MNTILGARISTLREEIKLTQQQVAEKLTWTCEKYVRLEKGKVDISYDSLVKIAAILNLSVGDITKVIDDQNIVSHNFGSNCNEVGEDKFDAIVGMIDMFYEHKRLYNSVRNV